jgi:hypothetical protein
MIVGDTVQTTNGFFAGFLDAISPGGAYGICRVNLQGNRSIFSSKMSRLVLASPTLDAQIRGYDTQEIPDPEV